MIFGRSDTYRIYHGIRGIGAFRGVVEALELTEACKAELVEALEKAGQIHEIECRRPVLAEQNRNHMLGAKLKKLADDDFDGEMPDEIVLQMATQISNAVVSIDGEPVELDPHRDIIPAMRRNEMQELWNEICMGGGVTAEEKPQS